MQKTTYQTPELRDANDNIIQQGAFGKNTAIANATNDGWIDYVMNNLEAVHGSVEDIEDAVTPKVGTADYNAGVWFSDTNNGAKLVRSGDFTYNPSLGRLEVSEIRQKDSYYYPQVNGGWFSSTESNYTGQLLIKPPVSITGNSINHYMYFTVIIKDYSHFEKRSFIHIGGLFNENTAVWTNVTAESVGGDIASVTFGNDGTKPCIAIGELTNKWTYAKAVICDLVTNSVNLNNEPWSISLSNTEMPTINKKIGYPSITEPADGGASHSVPYKGKNLGTSITDEQLSAIRDGSFHGINVCDYWSINNNSWYVAGINYFYGKGNPVFSKNHVVIVPRRGLYAAKMNSTATTDGGYVESELFAGLEENALPIIEEAFGAENILSHSIYLPTTCVDGEYTGNALYSSRKIDLLNTVMVFGYPAPLNTNTILTQNTQLPLFFYQPSTIRGMNASGTGRSAWLYDVSTDKNFRVMGRYGTLTSTAANATDTWVRPFFCVG